MRCTLRDCVLMNGAIGQVRYRRIYPIGWSGVGCSTIVPSSAPINSSWGKQRTPYSNLVEPGITDVGYHALIANNVVAFIVIGS